MELYPATYKDFTTSETWEGFSDHPQADSGLGFTCDIAMVPMVQALHRAALPTFHCCESVGPWMIRRKEVAFFRADPHSLLGFCLKLKATGLPNFDLSVKVDNYKTGPVFAVLAYAPTVETDLLKAIETIAAVPHSL
jgi:hypothetical protein